MNIIVDSNGELFIELVINTDYEYMKNSILDYFEPNYKSNNEITSWYEGFGFYKDNISIFYFNHYDLGNDRHCFEINYENINKRDYFKKLIENFEKYLKSIIH